MLDEILETKHEYLFDIANTNPRPCRIKKEILLKGNYLNGMERFMTMIARYFIFEEGKDLDEGIKLAKTALRMWCGHLQENGAEDEYSLQYEYLMCKYPHLEYWLVDYLREMVSHGTEKKMDEVEAGIKKITDKKEQYEASSLNKSASNNNYKTIYYDKIISNAISSYGPLRRYYLACNTEDWDKEIRVKGKTSKGGKCSDRQKEKIIKLLAAYMIERSRKPRHDDRLRFEPIGLKDVAYWAEGTSPLNSGNYKVYEVDGRRLFLFQGGRSGNLTKAKPDPVWFEACRWQLIEATDNDDKLDEYLDNNPDAVFYSDAGANIDLQLNTRYKR